MTGIRNIVILTGAGISAESGLATFRGPGGLWEGHRVEDQCFSDNGLSLDTVGECAGTLYAGAYGRAFANDISDCSCRAGNGWLVYPD